MAKQVSAIPSGYTSGAGGSVSAPTAGTQVAGITPPAGDYEVEVTWVLTGTAETQPANLRLKSMNANLITPLPSVTGQMVRHRFARVQCDGTNPLQLVAIANATAGAVYSAVVSASKIG